MIYDLHDKYDEGVAKFAYGGYFWLNLQLSTGKGLNFQVPGLEGKTSDFTWMQKFSINYTAFTNPAVADMGG